MTFIDLNDPATAKVLDASDVEATFGKGYRMQRVSLEMLPVGLWPFDLGGVLGKPVTRGIERKMPGIMQQLRERAHVFRIFKVGDPYYPQLGDFIRG